MTFAGVPGDRGPGDTPGGSGNAPWLNDDGVVTDPSNTPEARAWWWFLTHETVIEGFEKEIWEREAICQQWRNVGVELI